MVTIYNDYDEEPDDIFLPLSEPLSCEFYSLEMDNFTDDIDFFETLLPERGKILEMGCGTGRIAHKLAWQQKTANPERLVIGIDISVPMLTLAREKLHAGQATPYFFCMDMVRPAFRTQFDAILIPYNTLNLLVSEDKIIKCLTGCKEILHPDGKLLLQIFTPSKDFIRQEKTFQFQMFDRPQGGKIIKEILKQYEPLSQSVNIEERFRVRPMQESQANEDWAKKYTIAGFSAERWLGLFRQTGFTPTNIFSDYSKNRYNNSTSSILISELRL